MEPKTISVISKDSEYHKGKPFTINEEDFDPEKYDLAEPKKGPGAFVASADVEEAPLDTLTVAELRELAQKRGVELKGSTTKAAIIEAIEQAE
jgi:hypothetical protein